YTRPLLQKQLGLYHDKFLQPLRSAVKEGVISGKSFEEWESWVRDKNRDAEEKERSIKEVLPQYLEERRALALERKKLLGDPRLDQVTDSKLKTDIGSLKDDSAYFEKRSFTQRKNLVDCIAAGLAVMEGGEAYGKLWEKAENLLHEATRSPQPALHRDKVGTWLRRIFESGASPAEIEKFLHPNGGKGTLKDLIETWRAVAVQFWTLRKDPAFQGVTMEFIDTKAFLWKHFSERVSYVAWMREQAAHAQALRAKAAGRIGQSAQALDEGGQRRWLEEYVFNGKYNLVELQSIVSGNLTVRLENKVAIVRRYDAALAEAKKSQGARGMSLLERSTFLRLHYEQQEAKTVELEERLRDFRRQKPDFLLIRHLMDREDYEGAAELIEEAKKKPGRTLEDETKLHSMERTIALRQKEAAPGKQEAGKKLSEIEELDGLLESIESPGLQSIAIDLCNRGSESINALGWTSYNRDWCNRNGYLNPPREELAIKKGKAAALAKERRRKRGVVSETIQGETAEREYVELSRSSATNVCVDLEDSAARRAFAETLHLRRKDHRALYWTNTIFHRQGALMDLFIQREETRKIYKMRNLLRKTEAKGMHYEYRRTKQDLSETTSKVKTHRFSNKTHTSSLPAGER
ncbi:MAG: hypothetical protein AAB853_00110, partial [Patescibacteria group bacterium]